MRRAILTLGLLAAFAPLALAAPVPKGIKAKPVVRWKIAPKPGEKVYSVDWVDVPFKDVAEELEQLTGLMYLSKDVPTVKISLRARDVCAAELLEQVNDELESHNWELLRRSKSFCTVSAGCRYNIRLWQHVTLDDLPRRPREVVSLTLTVDGKGLDAGIELGRTMRNTLEVRSSGTDTLTVRGHGEDIQKFVDEMGEHIKK